MTPTDFSNPSILAFGPAAWPRGWVLGSPRYHLYGLAGSGWPVLYVEAPQGRLRGRITRKQGHVGTSGTVERWPNRSLSIFHPRTLTFFHPRLPLPSSILPSWNRWAQSRLSREVQSAIQKLHLSEFTHPDLLWLGSYSHAPLISRVPHRRSVTLIYDDLPASPVWKSHQSHIVARLERELLQSVDLAFFTSKVLLDSRRDQCRRAVLLENAVDETFFDESLPPLSSGSASEVLKRIDALPRPRIGYVGALNVRMDFSICKTLAAAAAKRSWQLVFAGPIDLLYGKGFQTLRGLPSVHVPGMAPPSEVPHLLRKFDVLLLPHVINDFTRGMFPEKLPEYLATGRPIVSTRVPEVVRIAGQPEGLVSFADSPDGFVEACDAALRCSTPDMEEQRIALARHHTRAKRLVTLQEALTDLLRES